MGKISHHEKISQSEIDKNKSPFEKGTEIPIFGKNGCCKVIMNQYGNGGWGSAYDHSVIDKEFYICGGEKGLKSFTYRELGFEDGDNDDRVDQYDKYNAILDGIHGDTAKYPHCENGFLYDGKYFGIRGVKWSRSDATNGWEEWKFIPTDMSEAEIRESCNEPRIFSSSDKKYIKGFDDEMPVCSNEFGFAKYGKTENLTFDMSLPGNKDILAIMHYCDAHMDLKDLSKYSSNHPYIKNDSKYSKVDYEKDMTAYFESRHSFTDASGNLRVFDSMPCLSKDEQQMFKNQHPDFGLTERVDKVNDLTDKIRSHSSRAYREKKEIDKLSNQMKELQAKIDSLTAEYNKNDAAAKKFSAQKDELLKTLPDDAKDKGLIAEVKPSKEEQERKSFAKQAVHDNGRVYIDNISSKGVHEIKSEGKPSYYMVNFKVTPDVSSSGYASISCKKNELRGDSVKSVSFSRDHERNVNVENDKGEKVKKSMLVSELAASHQMALKNQKTIDRNKAAKAVSSGIQADADSQVSNECDDTN